MSLIDKYLGESQDSKPISKGIFTKEGKKINLERSAKLQLGFLNDDNTLDIVTWKQFKTSKLPWIDSQKNSDYIKDKFLTGMRVTMQFNRQVDYNGFTKKGNPSFEDKVDWLITKGRVKYSKAGVKS